MELSEKRMRNQQMLRQREIDMFLERNSHNMHNSLNEIRESYERDIAEVDEEAFPEIVHSMREEMEIELENIRHNYERERQDGIDKINNKYKI